MECRNDRREMFRVQKTASAVTAVFQHALLSAAKLSYMNP